VGISSALPHLPLDIPFHFNIPSTAPGGMVSVSGLPGASCAVDWPMDKQPPDRPQDWKEAGNPSQAMQRMNRFFQRGGAWVAGQSMLLGANQRVNLNTWRGFLQTVDGLGAGHVSHHAQRLVTPRTCPAVKPFANPKQIIFDCIVFFY
jgi:hypothetical protein